MRSGIDNIERYNTWNPDNDTQPNYNENRYSDFTIASDRLDEVALRNIKEAQPYSVVQRQS